jgi:hypothetical protein
VVDSNALSKQKQQVTIARPSSHTGTVVARERFTYTDSKVHMILVTETGGADGKIFAPPQSDFAALHCNL